MWPLTLAGCAPDPATPHRPAPAPPTGVDDADVLALAPVPAAAVSVHVVGSATVLRDLRCEWDVAGVEVTGQSWTVDGAPGPGGSTVRADRLTAGQTWVCRVRVSQGGVSHAVESAPYVVPSPVGGNVLVVVLDDVGPDRIASYGLSPTPAPTPRLDALGAAGLRFTTVYATPACSTTRARTLTGRIGTRYGLVESLQDSMSWTLREEEVTLAELAKLAPTPRETAAFGKWHLATPEFVTEALVTSHGFDRFRGTVANLGSYDEWVEFGFDGRSSWRTIYPTTRITDDAADFVAGASEPWFTWVAYQAPHQPFDRIPPDELAPTSAAGGYVTLPDVADGMLEAVDTELGRLLDGMDPAVLERTTVVVLGDNGTAALVAEPPLDPARSKTSVYEAGVRVPMWIAGRAVTTPGVSSAMVDVADLFPTLADLFGVPLVGDEAHLALPTARGDVALDGRSLLPALRDPAWPGTRDTLTAMTGRPAGPPPWTDLHTTARDATHKLVVGPDGAEELFTLDPGSLVEGPDLLLTPPLSPADDVALQRLRATITDLYAGAPYEY
jgi:arylsulfatase A-like enzyme